MKLLVRSVALTVLACGGLCRPCQADSPEPIQIRRLVIESKTVPAPDRRRVVRQFEGGCFWVDEELGERIRMAFRDLGYFRAAADEPRVSLVLSGRREKVADVRVRVKAGVQYRLGEIQFKDAKAFPADRLREAFELQKGDLFNATKFGAGLENLRTLYGTAGYAEVSAVPEAITDESRHVIDWTIDISEGQTYKFGHLILDGPEPHAGAGYALLDSWSALEGMQYNPLLLKEWLAANRANWQNGSQVQDPTTCAPGEEPRILNLKLSFPVP